MHGHIGCVVAKAGHWAGPPVGVAEGELFQVGEGGQLAYLFLELTS